MKILITGGNGFIGSHLADSLLAAGHDVCVVDKNITNNTSGLQCEKVRGDINDPQVLGQVDTNPDVIFHAAAISRVELAEAEPKACIQTNVGGTLNLILWAKRAAKAPYIIFASSREVYGEVGSFPVPEDAEKKPLSVYGISKLMAEGLLMHYARLQALDNTIVRFSNVYGSARDLPGRVIPSFMRNALQGRPLAVYGGNQVLDFTHIEDVIEGLVNLVEEIENKNPIVVNNDFNFASSVGYSILSIAELVKKVTNSQSEVQITSRRRYDVGKFIGDSEKSQKCIKFNPHTTLEDGLKRLLSEITS